MMFCSGVCLQCWFACQRAVTVGATVLAPLLGHPLRGLALRARGIPAAARHSGFALGYPLATLGPHFVRRLPDRDRAWHLWSSSARCSGSRPPSRSMRRRSRRLRGDTRRNASSPGYRLLALRRVSPRIRRTASLHVAQFGTRSLVPCLTFHKARFSS